MINVHHMEQEPAPVNSCVCTGTQNGFVKQAKCSLLGDGKKDDTRISTNGLATSKIATLAIRINTKSNINQAK